MVKRDEDTRGLDVERWHDLNALCRNIRSRWAYAKLYEFARQSAAEPEIAHLLGDLLTAEQEGLSELASALRRLGGRLPDVSEDSRLMAQFRARITPLEKLEFLQKGADNASQWYREQAANNQCSDSVRDLFAHLARVQAEQSARLAHMIHALRGS